MECHVEQGNRPCPTETKKQKGQQGYPADVSAVSVRRVQKGGDDLKEQKNQCQKDVMPGGWQNQQIASRQKQVVNREHEWLGFPRFHKVPRHPLPMPPHPLKECADAFGVPVMERLDIGVLKNNRGMFQPGVFA